MTILDRYRATGQVPTLEEKLAETALAELPGFKDQTTADGRMTTELQQAIARRRAELGRR